MKKYTIDILDESFLAGNGICYVVIKKKIFFFYINRHNVGSFNEDNLPRKNHLIKIAARYCNIMNTRKK